MARVIYYGTKMISVLYDSHNRYIIFLNLARNYYLTKKYMDFLNYCKFKFQIIELMKSLVGYFKSFK